MKYQKKVIDQYALGKYCEIEYRSEFGQVEKKIGWLVPNNAEMFRSMPRYKYALLGANDKFFALNVEDFTKITLVSNKFELPKTIKNI